MHARLLHGRILSSNPHIPSANAAKRAVCRGDRQYSLPAAVRRLILMNAEFAKPIPRYLVYCRTVADLSNACCSAAFDFSEMITRPSTADAMLRRNIGFS